MMVPFNIKVKNYIKSDMEFFLILLKECFLARKKDKYSKILVINTSYSLLDILTSIRKCVLSKTMPPLFYIIETKDSIQSL